MQEPLKYHEDRVASRYRTALVFSVPVLIVLVLWVLYLGFGIVLVSPMVLMPALIVGLAIAAVPVTRHNLAKKALEREKKRALVAQLAQAMEEAQ